MAARYGSRYDAETVEDYYMAGANVDDFGFGIDRSDECPGALSVRLYVGCQLQGVHRPTIPLTRRDVAKLRRWSRGAAIGLPHAVQDWWMESSEDQQHEIQAMLRAVPWYMWLGFWLMAER